MSAEFSVESFLEDLMLVMRDPRFVAISGSGLRKLYDLLSVAIKDDPMCFSNKVVFDNLIRQDPELMVGAAAVLCWRIRRGLKSAARKIIEVDQLGVAPSPELQDEFEECLNRLDRLSRTLRDKGTEV